MMMPLIVITCSPVVAPVQLAFDLQRVIEAAVALKVDQVRDGPYLRCCLDLEQSLTLKHFSLSTEPTGR
jgi:hypothetical protein